MNWPATFKRRGTASILAVLLLTAAGVAALAGAGPETAGTTPTGVRSWPATAVIRFAGTSTLHDFAGVLPPQPFTLVLSNGTWSAAAEIRATGMSTDNAKRDRRMHEMLEAGAHPLIQGRVEAAAIPGPADGPATLGLRIRDRSLDLPVRVSAWEETPDAIRFHATWELSLAAYGLQPPSVIGLIRVGDRVRLEADVTATRPPVSPPAAAAPISTPP